MEKYGFVYIWRDKKHKKLYIGCHWGSEDDGYICSSTLMRNNYRNRPQDFRRKILQRVFTTRTDLLEVEYRWLQLIPELQLGVKFYNKNKHKFGHWSAQDLGRGTKGTMTITDGVKERRVDPALPIPPGWRRGRSPSTKSALSEKLKQRYSEDPKLREQLKQRYSEDTKFREQLRRKHPRVVGDDTRKKLSDAHRGKKKNYPSGVIGHFWITNGEENMRVPEQTTVSKGWRRGRVMRKLSTC